MRHFPKEKINFQKKFCAFWALDIAPNLDVPFCLIYFTNFFNVSFLYFFSYLQQTGVSKSPKGPPFTILKTLRFLSLRYSEDFGRSRFVCIYQKDSLSFFLGKLFPKGVDRVLYTTSLTGKNAKCYISGPSASSWLYCGRWSGGVHRRCQYV